MPVHLEAGEGMGHWVQDAGQVGVVCETLFPRLVPPHLHRLHLVGVVAELDEGIRRKGGGLHRNAGVFVQKGCNVSVRFRLSLFFFVSLLIHKRYHMFTI